MVCPICCFYAHTFCSALTTRRRLLCIHLTKTCSAFTVHRRAILLSLHTHTFYSGVTTHGLFRCVHAETDKFHGTCPAALSTWTAKHLLLVPAEISTCKTWNHTWCWALFVRDSMAHWENIERPWTMQIITSSSHHLSLTQEGRWGTTDDFTTSFLHFPLFTTALWD